MLVPILGMLSFFLAGYAASKLADGQGAGAKKRQPDPAKRVTSASPDDLITKVVRGVKFSTARCKTSIMMGDRLVEVPYPADEVGVRQIASMSELPRITPREHAMPDDLFYGRLALGETMVRQDLERRDATRELLVVQDCSGSMKWGNRGGYNRIRWALRLNQELIKRCIREGASYLLLPYASSPEEPIEASGEEELQAALERLPTVLVPDGGTATDEAVNAALDRVGQKEGEAVRRMVLVTDGDDSNISSSTASRLREMGVHLHAVMIGEDNFSIRRAADRYDLLEMPS